MADKAYSFSRGLLDTYSHGCPMHDVEQAAHYGTEREMSLPQYSALRERSIDAPDKNKFYAPLSCFLPSQRDLTVSGGPSVGGATVPTLTRGRSDLVTWSAVLQAGAEILDNLKGNVTPWQVATLPTPQWLAETGMSVPTTITFSTPPLCQPRRLSASLVVSRQLLAQAGPSPKLDALLIADLSRQLGAYLDLAALVGTGPANFQPLGLLNTPGVTQLPSAPPDWQTFIEAQQSIEELNIDTDSYAVIVSPAIKAELSTTFISANFPRYIWEAIAGISSPQLAGANQRTAFFGAWQMLSILIWGSSVEILIDPYALASTFQVRIHATILADISVRLPQAFAVTTFP